MSRPSSSSSCDRPARPAPDCASTSTSAVSRSRASPQNKSCNRSALAWSRLPVGSSASSTSGRAPAPAPPPALLLAAGELAGPVVSCAPPGPTPPAAPRRAAAPCASSQPRDQQRHHHVLERRELAQQVMELEHEARSSRLRSSASCSSDKAVIAATPSSRIFAGVGPSSAPSRCSSVLFPAPLAPTIATISPRATLRSTPSRTSTDVVAAAVGLAHPAGLEQRGHSCRIASTG